MSLLFEKSSYIIGKGLETSFNQAVASAVTDGELRKNFKASLSWTCRMSVLVRYGVQLGYACFNSCKSFFVGMERNGKDNINAKNQERA